MMLSVVLLLGSLLLLQKLWMAAMIARFFRQPIPSISVEPRLISILQPILSGDPTLPKCLEHNLQVACRYPIEFLWLVDTDDVAGQTICRTLIDKYSHRSVQLLLQPPPPDRCNPKMIKLQAGIVAANGDVLCVLDDDTMLPSDGLETALAYLDGPRAGLAFGLPYYVSFENFWSRLVAFFVNSHSLLTYVPYVGLIEPFTINGMFYVFRRETYQQIGGFADLEHIVADDFAVAQKFLSSGLRLMQTPVRHPISTHVSGPQHYARLLHRWFIFPRETVMKSLPWRGLVVTYGMSLLPAMAPLLWLIVWLMFPRLEITLLAIAYGAIHYVLFAWCNATYLHRVSPWSWSWLVVVVQCLLPFQLLIALVSPQRINWRGHLITIERGGVFRLVRRRTP